MNTCLPPPSHLNTVGNILFSVSLADMERGMPSMKSSSSLCADNTALKQNRRTGRHTYVGFRRVLREQRFRLVAVRVLIENERLTLRLLRRRRRRDQPRRLVPLTAAGVAHGRVAVVAKTVLSVLEKQKKKKKPR